MILHAKSNIDDIVKKEANIDGAGLLISEKHRVQSPPFNFSFPANNIYGVKKGQLEGLETATGSFLSLYLQENTILGHPVHVYLAGFKLMWILS